MDGDLMTPMFKTALECAWSTQQFDLVSIYGMHKQGMILNKWKKERLAQFRDHYEPTHDDDDDDDDDDEYPLSNSNVPTKLGDGTKLHIKGDTPIVSKAVLLEKEGTQKRNVIMPKYHEGIQGCNNCDGKIL